MQGSPERLYLPSGTVLYGEGDAASTAYLILRGRIELLASRDGVECKLGERRAGDMVGECAIIDDGPRSVSAVAGEDCDLLVVTRDQISRRVEAADPLLRVLLGTFMDRRRGATAVQGSEARRLPDLSAWTDHFNAARRLLTSEHELRRAVEQDELELYFQPIVRLTTRDLVGFEALLRWNHPERGLILPGAFIPLAEASGVINDVTTACLKKVARQFPALSDAARANPSAAHDPLFVNVNISGLDLERESFAATTASVLSDGGLDPRRVHLEITESVLIKNADACARTLQQCRDQGMQIAIDDFGTGYSSLNYLNTLPVSTLKIDRSFAQSLLSDLTGRKIIGAILHLASELALTVVAEGIEEESEAALLSAMGCDLGQGYLFGRPCDLRQSIDLVGAWGRDPVFGFAQPRRACA